MKAISILTILGISFTLANVSAGETHSCCKGSTAALSPRAQASQPAVVAGASAGETARAELGTAARAKASGGAGATVAATPAKDVNLAHRHNDLGAAAKAKSTGNTGSPAIQIAPLK